MSKHEIIIQWLKIAIACSFGGYLVWWSLQVLAFLAKVVVLLTQIIT